ncbi:MAG: DUF4197 domain-containing protein [Verrucomicrobia bacterium]|nr:DUF4197 domain-containing protein [Verrucomicrobiota bacterium]
MTSLVRALVLFVAVLAAPVAFPAEPAPAVPAAPAGLSDSELAAGLKSALGSALENALGKLTQSGGLKLSPPPALAKIEAAVGKTNPAEAGGVSSALSSVAAKLSPQMADLLRESFKNVKIEDAKAVLSGGPDAGTQFLRKAMGATLREKLLPLVKEATASAGVAAKAKDMLSAAGPLAALGGNKGIADLDGYVCDQVINKSFQLLAKEEAALRANPALLTQPLAQKAFALFKK